jgi:hypothetical protein
VVRQKQWICTRPDGSTFTFWAPEALGKGQALNHAGLMLFLDVASIKEAS